MVISLLFSLHDCLRDYLKKKFHIYNLPRLALNEVLQSMSKMELIRLALTSSKMERIIKSTRIKLRQYSVQVRGGCSNIDFGKNISILFCGDLEFPRDEKIRKYQMKKWSDKDCGIANLSEIRNRLKNIFKCQRERLVIEWSTMGSVDISKNSFLLDAMQNSHCMLVHDGKISSKDLRFIMENANPDQDLQIDVEVPEDFKSPYAFKFLSVIYNDARWLKVEDLYTMRNIRSVNLIKNKLSTSDINSLIKYWLDCDNEMFETLDISWDRIPPTEELFEGLLVLETHYTVGALYILLSKSTKKLCPLLTISYSPGGICISSFYTDEEIEVHESGPVKTFQEEYEVLQILTRKKELESKSTPIEEEVQELEKLKKQLDEHQVFFVDGMAVME